MLDVLGVVDGIVFRRLCVCQRLISGRGRLLIQHLRRCPIEYETAFRATLSWSLLT